MRSFILCLMATFCFSQSSMASNLIGEFENSDGCMCLYNPNGHSITGTFDGVDFFWVANGETQEKSDITAGTLLPYSRLEHFERDRLPSAPFFVVKSKSRVIRSSVYVNFQTGEVKYLGISLKKDKKEKKLHSTWVRRCVCAEKQEVPGKNKVEENYMLKASFPR